MSERKLASIQKIEKLEQIENADFIEKCKLYDKEWQFVVKKNDFKIDDLCVYFEIDSLLPEKEWSEFMRPRKFRVKTIKLRKVISQGLCLPVNSFVELKNKKLEIDMDVTEILGVQKYLTPIERNELLSICQKKKGFFQRYFGFKKIKGRWPTFIKKTDEERIQNMNYSKIYERYKNKEFYFTEKIDGQSATFFVKHKKLLKFFKQKYFGVCSRNIWLKRGDNSLFWKVARKYNIENILKRQKNEMIIQGEQCFQGVQNNRYGFSGPKLFIFNIIEIKNGEEYHYDYERMEEFCEKHNLEMVPLLGCHFLPENVNDIIELSKGKSKIKGNIQREGIVIRRIYKGNKELSFKVINPEYLLKYE